MIIAHCIHNTDRCVHRSAALMDGYINRFSIMFQGNSYKTNNWLQRVQNVYVMHLVIDIEEDTAQSAYSNSAIR